MKNKNFRLLYFFLCFLFASQSFSQTTVSIADGSVQTCNGVLFDSGGQGASGYQNGENYTLTICPDIPGDVVTVVFNNFALDPTNTLNPPASNADNLSIYDGNSTAAPTLGTYTDNQLQGTIVSTTSANTSGCLTFVFVSNGVGTGTFSGTITCNTPCQPPTALFTAPTIAQNPQRICDGEVISFDASGSTAQPTFNIVDYIFDYGDGVIDTLQTPFSSHAYNNGPGEYLTKLYVIDDNGCVNVNSEIITVWVSTVPIFNTNMADSAICLGESTCIDGSTIIPTTYTPAPSSTLSGTTYLPDDVGQCFTASLDFDFFTPGQTLNNINDLHGICVEMEHSFMGDLVASIICPNGTSVVMHQQGGGGVNLGDPIQADDSLQPGTGWEYCWSPAATNGTWVDNSNAGNTIVNSTGSNSLIPGNYESLNPLNPLVGCPLNGVWTIEFCDLWGADDGFVFDFSIDLDTSLYPSLTTFTPTFGLGGDSTYWTSSGIASTFITSTSADSNLICLTPTDTGAFDYTFVATDDFGCTYDTTVTLYVTPGPIVDAGNDTALCNGSLFQLNAAPAGASTGPCNYTLEMYDTFGDGWNGFSVEIVVNGNSLGNFTFNAGISDVATFTVNGGDNIVINTVSGTWDSEVSYQILDCSGNSVFSDGVNYTGNLPFIGANIFSTTGTTPQLQYSYSWTPTIGLSDPNIANPILTVIADTSYVVEMWEPGHQLCSSFDTISITTVPLGSSPGIDGDTLLCRTDPPFDMFNLLGGTPDNNGVWINSLNDPISNIFDPSIDVSGVYSYYVGSGSCADTAHVTITNPDLVLISNHTSDTTICINGTANLYANGTGGIGILDIIWNTGLMGSGPFGVSPMDSTQYTVFARDSIGCTSPIETVIVTLHDPITVENMLSDTVCPTSPGNSTSLTAFANGGDGNGYVYSWFNGNNDPIGTSQSITVTPTSNPETFTVRVEDNCTTPEGVGTVDIYLHTPIVPVFSVDKPGDCFPATLNFTNNTDLTHISSVNWSFGDGSTGSSIESISNTYSSPGCYTVGLEITSTDGCVFFRDSTDMVCAYSYPQADFDISHPTTYVPLTEIDFTNTSSDASTYQWYIVGRDSSFSVDLTYEFPQHEADYEVCLTAISDENCTHEICKTVIIKEEITPFIPNSFSPDADNLNEVFLPIFNTALALEYSFRVFDRWGDLVFETNNPNEGWNGVKHGKNVLKAGTYVYKIKIKDPDHRNHDYFGSINLIR